MTFDEANKLLPTSLGGRWGFLWKVQWRLHITLKDIYSKPKEIEFLKKKILELEKDLTQAPAVFDKMHDPIEAEHYKNNCIIACYELHVAKQELADRQNAENLATESTSNASPIDSSGPSDKDRIIAVQNKKITMLMKKTKWRKGGTPEELRKLADDCRFKNGKINFSKLGALIGLTGKAVKARCKDEKIE